MKVATAKEAWEAATAMFPTDYILDIQSSERAGYPIYRSTDEDHWYDHISDLNARLEVNIGDNSINIWIQAATTEEQPNDESHIEVNVTALKSGEMRSYKSYEDFISDWRFFLSGGRRYDSKYGYETDEERFDAMVMTLRKFNNHGMSMETFTSGLGVQFIYYRWPWRDRYMNPIKCDTVN